MAASTLPPIFLYATALDALADFHDEVRKRAKLPEGSKTFDSLWSYESEARRRFGPDKLRWAWTCHHCGTTATAADYAAVGAPQPKIGFACVGSFLPGHPCNYDGNKPYPINPVTVQLPGRVKARMLAFAER